MFLTRRQFLKTSAGTIAAIAIADKALALTALQPTFPNGQVKLDANRNSVQPAYVVQVVNNGKLGFKVARTVPQVSQDFGGAFKPGAKAPGRDSPACVKGPVPAWAH